MVKTCFTKETLVFIVLITRAAGKVIKIFHLVDYARPVTSRIVEIQTLTVDAITGATTTSKCIMKAAENALKGAKRDDKAGD